MLLQTRTGHGFNKSTFDYTSPYNEHHLTTTGITSLPGLPGGVGRRAAAAPVYIKRLSIGENSLLQRGSSESTKEVFSLDDFEDNDFEVLITVNTDDDENEESLEPYDVYQNNAELSDIESVRNPSQKSSRSTSPNGSTCITYMRVSGLRSLDSGSDLGSVGKKENADDATRHKNEVR